MSSVRSVVLGCGSYLPQEVLTNDDLAARVDTSDQWIRQRTGIHQRHIAAAGELTSDLGVAAARAALSNAGLSVNDIDMIVVATSTPDNTFPATAVTVQDKLGMSHGWAFDLQAVCSGFLYALATADGLIRAGRAEKAIVVGAETFSRIVDWTDRATCILFGDGAGAVVLGGELQTGSNTDRGLLTAHLRSDGHYKPMLYTDGGPSSTGTVGQVRMHGREVFKHAVTMIGDVIADAFTASGLDPAEIDWFVPHQANVRIIDATAKKFDIPLHKVIRTIDRHGNTSAASIPLALAEAARDGRIKHGDLLLLESMGGGFTWASAILRW